MIYYVYSNKDVSECTRDELMDEEEERKEAVLRKLFENQEDRTLVEKRVHVPVGFDIW